MLMTAEMWHLGFAMDPWRLGLLLALSVPMLIALSHLIGFEDTFNFTEDLLDAFVAFGVGSIAGFAFLLLFGVVDGSTPVREIVGKVALQAVPGSIGALLAQSQLGAQREQEEQRKAEGGYAGELFIMLVGALFLGFNVAPTVEVVTIAHMMRGWHAVLLTLSTVAIVHAFVYSVEFRGHHGAHHGGASGWKAFAIFTLPGYAICVSISAYVLWTFGRLDGLEPAAALVPIIVLSLPAAVGAASARLVL